MHFQILEIILWPKKRQFKPRRVPFRTGVVNVITGASQTGKSAIVPIIDYCLGSGRCAIPVNTIRDHVEWFGVLVETSGGQTLLARREPGEYQATGDMYVVQSETPIAVPDSISAKNSNRDFVKLLLDELSGLTTLDFDPLGEGTFRARPSFRDMAAFNFQAQNIIANPDVLFFKADTVEHREKLRTIFPYVLGVVTPDILAKRYRLEELRRDERRIQRELQSLQVASENLLSELHSYVSRARELGLLKEDDRQPDQQTALRLLRRVINRTAQPDLNPNAFQSLASELLELRQRESELSLELTQMRQRWVEMNRLREAALEYRRALEVEEERLGISQWLLQESERGHSCPVCGNEMEETTEQLKELVSSLREVEETQTSFRTLPPTFDREYARVRSRIESLTRSLDALQKRIAQTQQASDEERGRRYTELSISRFVGRLESQIATYDKFTTDEDLRTKWQKIAEEIAQLRKEVDEQALKNREKRALDRLSVLISALLPELGVEKAQDPVQLSTNELTLKIRRLQREDFLWEVGSGSNWLGYHLAVALALHEYFDQISDSPVPSFLVLDQPTQVFFPQKLAADPVTVDLDPKLADDDIKRVRSIFNVISRVTLDLKGKLQIILLDHAGTDAWGNLPGMHRVEEWRNGVKLVPQEWLT